MRKTLAIIPAEAGHAILISRYLRQAHLDEARVLGIHPAQQIAEQIADSYEAWTGAVDGRIGAIWGVKAQALLGDEAYPWIVTTSVVDHNVRIFMEYSQSFVKRWAGLFPKLRAFCHIQNEKSARWLEWMGFEEIDGVPNFRQFTIGVPRCLS